MERIIRNGKCLDLNLMNEEDIDFYLISSKDNIIINLNNKLICYTKPDIKNEAYRYRNIVSFGKDSYLKNIQISYSDYLKLINKKYNVYNIVKMNNKYELLEFNFFES
jgi:hypothetical protein